MKPDRIFYLFLLPCFNLLAWLILRISKTVFFLLPGLVLFGGCVLLLADNQVNGFWQLPTFLPGFDIVLQLDGLRLWLSVVSTGIAFLTHAYSFHYLSGKQHFGYYSTLFSIFTAAMVWFFLAGNLFTLILGWEVVGICSYLLVQFWFESPMPVQAGLKVALINKLGDVALVAGAGLLVSFGFQGVVGDQIVFIPGSEVFFSSKTGTVLCLFLALAAFVKSAQFPFNLWLREAMQGPTSVSALLHSATMVVAGVWLLFQLSPAFSVPVLVVLVVVGSITLIVSNIAALFSNHFKVMLAFSTMAQLGLMVVCIGLQNEKAAVLHITTHAFFKASLFLACGLVIRLAHFAGLHGTEEQYFPNLKGYLRNQTWVRFAFLFSAAALAGWPLTSGFISKEAMVPDVFSCQVSPLYWFGFVVIQISICLTAIYVTRMCMWLCFGEVQQAPPSSPTPWFSIPIVLLAFGSGFWLIGLNPFSTQGWLLRFWGFEGRLLHPDVAMLLLGTWLGWRSLKNGEWHFSLRFKALQDQLVSLSAQNSAYGFMWKQLVAVSKMAVSLERNALNRPLNIGAKGMVVVGYFSAFVDKNFVDGFVSAAAGASRAIGHFFWEESGNKPQYAVFFVGLFLALLYLIFL